MAHGERINFDPSPPEGGANIANGVSKLKEGIALIHKGWDVMYQLTYDPLGTQVINLVGSEEFGVESGDEQKFYDAVNYLKASVDALPADILAKLYKGSVNF